MPANVAIVQTQGRNPARTGGKIVGTTPVQLTTRNAKLDFGMYIVVDSSAGNVWVSEDPSLSAGGGAANSGVEILPGQNYLFPTDNPSKVWAISDTGTTEVSFLYY